MAAEDLDEYRAHQGIAAYPTTPPVDEDDETPEPASDESDR